MADERTEDRIKDMIVERLFLQVAPREIGDEQNLMEAYELDSVRLFEIVIGLEEVFGCSFEDDEFDIRRFRTVASIAQVVKEKQAKAPAAPEAQKQPTAEPAAPPAAAPPVVPSPPAPVRNATPPVAPSAAPPAPAPASVERIEDRIKKMIVERLFLQVEPGAIGDDEDLAKTYEVDSPKLFEIIIGLEENFGCSFEDEEFDQKRFNSVSAIAEVVRGKLSGADAGQGGEPKKDAPGSPNA